ncbi:hypothetical protein GQ464_006005 [Rhodocaloribacter litoris]|nr:hypothetical protein GQ464_006005 [Rhodocaloribacter litoris]
MNLRTAPTVSRDKWVHHARTKMLRGYALIVSENRHTANFFMPGKGYEACPYHVARKMIREGLVVEGGRHTLGTLYLLAPHAAEVLAPPRPDEDEIEETSASAGEFDMLLDEALRTTDLTDEDEDEDEPLDELDEEPLDDETETDTF